MDSPRDSQEDTLARRLETRAGFFERYSRDLLASEVGSRAEYQALFPGHEELIGQLYDDAIGEGPVDTKSANERIGRLEGEPSRGPEHRLGQYRIEREIGRGGQGEVYLAEDTKLQRRVALKILRHLGPGSEETVRRFQREAELAAGLDHAGICSVHEAGVLNGTPYIAMQFIEGETLSRKIALAREADCRDVSMQLSFGSDTDSSEPETDARPVAEESSSSGPSDRASIMGVVRLVEQAARALHAAHESGVIHRDIKPGNVMVTPSGDAVLLDFGLARGDQEDMQALTLSSDFFGTPAYMPPEQIDGDMRQLDRRADVYSLGATLFECLALRKPFEEPTREALFNAIKTTDASDVGKLNPAVPRDLSTIVEKTLQKDRDRRYETAQEFAEELRRVREYEPIRARPVTRWVRVKRWAQRNPGVAVSLTLFILALLTGLLVNTALLDKVTGERDRADANLISWQRMTDVRLFKDLEREAETELWPPRPEKIPVMDRWVERATNLISRRESHKRTLAEIREGAEPYTKEHERKDLETHPEALKLAELRARLDASPDDALRSQVSTLEREVATRRTWHFSDLEQQYRHEVFMDLCNGLSRMVAEDGLQNSIRKRRDFARTLRQETIEKHQRAWDEARARVAGDERFEKFQLKPQIGLVPLGADPSSGLEEFWVFEHVQLGTQPVRDATGKLTITESTGVVVVLLPGGRFMMGRKRGPLRHEVRLAPFFMSKYEMTQGQWKQLAGHNPSYLPPPRRSRSPVTLQHPVENITWFDCQRYLPRAGLQLPTEAQWEYACRGGTTTVWWCGDDVESIEAERAGNILDQAARWRWPGGAAKVNDGHTIHAPIGSFAPNPFGLHDVLGNVNEWCRDRHGPYSLPTRGPDGERVSGSLKRVSRGGGFRMGPNAARSGNRNPCTPNEGHFGLGCRPVRPVEP